jgi:hypothetical protein
MAAKSQRYFGHFSDLRDVFQKFNVSASDVFPTERGMLVASYNVEGYEGSAFVLFRHKGVLYEVHGSHCSCYGLEDQWKPEVTSWKAIALRVKNDHSIYGLDIDAMPRLRALVARHPPRA